ncbi:hypothetical protein GCM10025863_08150 [Microbacterium suwonense]|uniref:Uncharacterized protein n=1 Tax=Microbacterium suwonense TaxID=683047 RepID=A0ABM8FR97_9MICO|nr:hypothetical protein GCM10025863_08150 [Microbacterium suwonense]
MLRPRAAHTGKASLASRNDASASKMEATVAPITTEGDGYVSTVNSFGAKSTLTVGSTDYEIFRIDTVPGSEKLPSA